MSPTIGTPGCLGCEDAVRPGPGSRGDLRLLNGVGRFRVIGTRLRNIPSEITQNRKAETGNGKVRPDSGCNCYGCNCSATEGQRE
jgi:hypothetical protein